MIAASSGHGYFPWRGEACAWSAERMQTLTPDDAHPSSLMLLAVPCCPTPTSNMVPFSLASGAALSPSVPLPHANDHPVFSLSLVALCLTILSPLFARCPIALSAGLRYATLFFNRYELVFHQIRTKLAHPQLFASL